MNKRFYYIIGIMIALLCVCVWEQISVQTYFGKIEEKIYHVIEVSKDKENINTTEIYDLVVDLEKDWSDYEATLCFMVNLKDVEDLGVELTKAKVYIIENNIVEFNASLSLMLFYIDGYYNLMGISLENVF